MISSEKSNDNILQIAQNIEWVLQTSMLQEGYQDGCQGPWLGRKLPIKAFLKL